MTSLWTRGHPGGVAAARSQWRVTHHSETARAPETKATSPASSAASQTERRRRTFEGPAGQSPRLCTSVAALQRLRHNVHRELEPPRASKLDE